MQQIACASYPKEKKRFVTLSNVTVMLYKNLRTYLNGLLMVWTGTLALFLSGVGSAIAQLPTAFQKVELVTGLKNSVNFEFAPDGRIFIVDRYGELFIYKPTTQTTVSAGTLNVFHDMEDGFLSIAFDPEFLSNSYVYVHYSHPTLPKNRVSRFVMNGDQIDLTSEIVMLEWTSDRNGYYHAAGDLDFDSKGNLYIAIGDNTNHTPYAALNETDRNQSAERTSSNTNDLRGKILRIKPMPDGTYTIPDGNLFPGGVGGRAEIYVMGARNPYKIFVDKSKTDWLFWGEVGPDANSENENGPEGMDEINLVKSAGNYGWPYLSGKNEPYLNNYAVPKFYYDHTNPVNISKWNTGSTNLPPARGAWLDFFHACYLAGPRYYYSTAINNSKKLPSDFHEGFFYYDFNTSKMWVVHMDASGAIKTNQPFAHNIIKGSGFIDLKIGPDGQLYILEYGAGCCPNNVGTGKLSRIDYTGIDSNKSPEVSVSANVISGPLPLEVNFSSAGTRDLDGDALSYAWDFQSDGTVDSTVPNPSFTFETKGTFNSLLVVTDARGASVSKSITIYPGNTAATFQMNSPPDGGLFSWEDNINYNFQVVDAEDGATANGSINCNKVSVVPAFGHLNHSHDGITINTCSGVFYLNPAGHDAQGQDNIYYLFKTNYTDNDGLTTYDQVIVYPKITEAEFYTDQNNTKLIDNTDELGGGVYSVRALSDKAYIKIDGRNLLNINSVSYRVASAVGGTIELRTDTPDGPLVTKTPIPVTGSSSRWTTTTSTLTNPGGKHDLYFVFRNSGGINFVDLNYIEFNGAGVSTDVTPPNIYSLSVLSQTQLSLKFNEALDPSSAQTISNYTINNGIKISAVKLEDDRKTVRIMVSSLAVGIQYGLTIKNVKNASGVSGPDIVRPFTLNEAMVRINAGGPLVDINGAQWLASKFNTGGSVGSNPNLAIGNTTADALYQTELNGNFTINIPVENAGLYDLKLHFAELVYKNSGGRIFNINIENNQYSLLNYDIFSKVGYANALIESFENIKVEDGYLTIVFTGVVNKAKLSALEVFYGKKSNQEPSIVILNPGKNMTLAQPFKVTFKVENWWVGPGSSRVHKIVDGVKTGDLFSTDPITFTNLSPGTHTLKLVLADASGNAIDVSDEVQVTVTSGSACIDNPFPTKWEQIIIGADLAYRSPQILAADIDGDGLKDIVTGGWWFKNPGFPKGLWEKNTVGPPMNNMFLIHDFDNDGDPDLLGTNGKYLGTQLAWAENDGKGNFVVHTNISEAAGFPAGSTNNNTFLAGVAVGNFNGVANVQIALVWNGSETTKAPVKMLTVPANPVTQEWTAKDIAPNAVGEAIVAVDIDKDGDLDLSQAKNWLRNDNGVWTTFTTGVTLPTYYEHHTINDFDRDGSLDGVVTQIGENQEIVAFKIAADPTKTWTKSTLGTDVDSGLSLDVADLDFDGDLDIITGEWKSEKRLIAFENDLCNSGGWIKHILHPGGSTGPDHHNGTQAVDLDNDGDLDIISVGWDKRTPRIFINNESTVSGNTAPVVANTIPNQPASTGVLFNFTFNENTFYDADDDALSYSVTLTSGANLPSWLSFNAATRTFKGTPPAASSATVLLRLTANDNNGGTASVEFGITFVNQAPVVSNPIPDQSFKGGSSFSFIFAANAFTDPNGDPLVFSARAASGGSLPSWLNFASTTRTFTGEPAITDAGIYEIEVSASDGNESVSDIFKLAITDPTINQPPVAANQIPDINAVVGVNLNYTFDANAFTDPNSDPLTYSALLSDSNPLPSWLTFNGTTRTFSGIPATNNLGTLEIVVTANDGKLTASQSFRILVENVGSTRMNSGGPVVNGYGVTFEADKFFKGGGTYTNTKIVDIAGTNADDLYRSERNNAFSYEVPLPSGVYTIRLHFAEIYFGATGGGTGGVGTRVFNVVAEGQPLLTNFDVFAEAGGAMKAVVREFDISITDGLLNLNFVKVVQNPKVSAVEVVLKSTSSNSPPIVSNPIPDQNATVGMAFAYSFPSNTFSDADADPLTYSASLTDGSPLPSWIAFSPSGRSFNGTPASGDVGTYSVRVTAADGKGGMVSDVFIITVNGTTPPPPAATAIRINSGGPKTTINGTPFAADNLFIGGSVYTNKNVLSIAGTEDDIIYLTERYKMDGYDIPLPSGEYLLRLHFAEIYFGATGGGVGAPGKRVFNVTAEDAPLLTNLDVYAEVGAMTALVKEFNINVTDGVLNLRFIRVVENPKINAIEVISVNSSTGTSSIGDVYTINSRNAGSHILTAYPNPMNTTTTIEYRPVLSEDVSMRIVSPLGVAVREVFDGRVESGNVYTFEFDATELAEGVYIGRVTSRNGSSTIKLVVVR